MKFTSFTLDGRESFGVIFSEEDGYVYDLKKIADFRSEETNPANLQEWISLYGEKSEEFIREMRSSKINFGQFRYSMDEIILRSPIPKPIKNIFCVGKNYAAHAIEMGSEADIPDFPIIFTKPPTCVIATHESIYSHPNVTTQLDYEGELAVVIGKKGRAISKENALDYVFGYTIINDVSARDLQKRHKQFFMGKSLDTSCPMGPVILHKSAVNDPHNLSIVTRVNGEVRQNGNTKDFIFDIPELLEVISQAMTLEPGDIIATGTPSGVGKGFKPPRFLKPGDRVEITIEGLGTLVNTVK
ncbi:fumarylacetoacetate hydrolase family protein [Pseudalkalibacillus caeni]|uniref:Fumarylacetoacetate hydrolase family protein n=1 Tax=Exobacillus caeni TaxID=2574798 RepID=A0A5R9FBF6_9BACL|nr:fumarylacetoacetate hydrolase family protein [Pseudalkalibacillus caeni]TLS37874.1 fumarylacetoacetate hydrolase family protein [Pseudalkalibacillus caeni]